MIKNIICTVILKIKPTLFLKLTDFLILSLYYIRCKTFLTFLNLQTLYFPIFLNYNTIYVRANIQFISLLTINFHNIIIKNILRKYTVCSHTYSSYIYITTNNKKKYLMKVTYTTDNNKLSI